MRGHEPFWLSRTGWWAPPSPVLSDHTFQLPPEPGEGAGVVTVKGQEFFRRGDHWVGPTGAETWRDLLYFDGPVCLSHLPDKVTTEASIDAQIESLQAEVDKAQAELIEDQPPLGSWAIDKDGQAWQRTFHEYWTSHHGLTTKTVNWTGLNANHGPLLMVTRATDPSETPKVSPQVDQVALPEELGEGAIVVDQNGTAWQHFDAWWHGHGEEMTWGYLLQENGPVTVLHTGHTG